MKKAMIEVQFNWIFILIVGTLILLFFIGLTSWIREYQEKQMAGSAMDNIKTMLTTTQMNPQTAQPLSIPDIELQFTCDTECSNAGCPSNFQFVGVGIPRETEVDVIFAPEVFRGNNLHVWTQEWRMPYKVTNFQYISNDQMWFYLVYDENIAGSENLARAVQQKLRENEHLNFEMVKAADTEGITYKNQKLVKYILFNDANPKISSSIIEEDVYDVVFVDGNENAGTITYPSYSQASDHVDINRNPSQKAYYIGMPMLLGAIFADDYDFYLCNQIKAFLKLRAVNEVYRLRTDAMYYAYIGKNDNVCHYYYDDTTLGHFRQLDLYANNTMKNIIDGSPYDTQLSLIKDEANQIESVQNQAKLKSCAGIY